MYTKYLQQCQAYGNRHFYSCQIALGHLVSICSLYSQISVQQYYFTALRSVSPSHLISGLFLNYHISDSGVSILLSLPPSVTDQRGVTLSDISQGFLQLRVV